MSDMERTAVIVGAARLPTGRFLGGLSPLKAPELGARAIAGVVERSGVAPADIQDVIMGVLPFIGALVCLIGLLLLFPDLATWLPTIMGGGR